MIIVKSTAFTSDCCGHIAKWYVNPADTTDAHLYVWRPVDISKDEYLLVGVNNVSRKYYFLVENTKNIDCACFDKILF